MILLLVPWLGYLDGLVNLVGCAGYPAILAAGACVYAAYKIFYALYLSPLRNVPGPFLARLTPKRAELLGLTGAQARKALEEYERYGDVYVYQPNSISISNPADIRKVLGSHSYRKTNVYNVHDYLGQKTTISAQEPKLASMKRRQIGPYFTNSYLAKMEGAILEHGILAIKEKWDGLLKQSENGQVEINYHKTLLYATFDTIGSLAFGREFGSLRNDDPTVGKWLTATMTYLGMQVVFPLIRIFPFSLALLPLKRLNEEFIAYGAKCIADRRKLLAKLEQSGDLDMKPADLLQGFLEAEDSESKARMSPAEVHAETILMLLAGSETSSSSLLWTIHLFTLYPECYRQAVEETRSAFEKDHVITYAEAKAKLPYLEACIYESIRLVPAADGQVPRVVPQDGVTLSTGHFIPGGTEINVNISGANMNKRYWSDPHRYDPTRFLNNEEAKRRIFTFGGGVRVCPGKQLAWVEMFTILANILKDYDLRLPDDYTLYGPNVIGEDGYPMIMDHSLFITKAPAYPERDCRLVISKHY